MQATLEGIAPPPTAPDSTLRLAVRGLLLADAQVRHLTNGDAVLICVLRQHLQHHPLARHLMATLTYPAHGAEVVAHQAAYSKARALRAGVEVVVVGSGLEPHLHEGEPVLRFISVEAIKPADDIPT